MKRWNILSRREAALIVAAMWFAFVLAFIAGRAWGYYG